MRGRGTLIQSAVVALVAGVALAGGATQAAPSSRTVDAHDFPTVAEVARILPAFEGGTRTIEADHPIWIFQSNCSAFVNGPSGEVRKFAYYYGVDHDLPSYPEFYVQEFASPSDAKQAIRTIRRNIEGCYGEHQLQVSEGTVIRRPADVPSLGAGDPVAWKMNDHWTDIDTGIKFSYYARRIWMREGETVVGMILDGQHPQSRRASIRFARLALRSVD